MDKSFPITINIYYHEVNDYIEYFSYLQKEIGSNINIDCSRDNSNIYLYKLIKEELDYVLTNLDESENSCDIIIDINLPSNMGAFNVYLKISNIYKEIKQHFNIKHDLIVKIYKNEQVINCKVLEQ